MKEQSFVNYFISKNELSIKLEDRLKNISSIKSLFNSSTSLTSVCFVIAAIVVSSNEHNDQLYKNEWNEDSFVFTVFIAFRLIFVRALEVDLNQLEKIIISLGGKMVEIVDVNHLSENQTKQVLLMRDLDKKLMARFINNRNQNMNML